MRDRHMGFLGDEMIVNGKRHFVLPVGTINPARPLGAISWKKVSANSA